MVTGVLPTVALFARGIQDGELGASLLQDPALLLALAASIASFPVNLPVVRYCRLSLLLYSPVAVDSMLISIVGRGVPWNGRRYRPPSA